MQDGDPHGQAGRRAKLLPCPCTECCLTLVSPRVRFSVAALVSCVVVNTEHLDGYNSVFTTSPPWTSSFICNLEPTRRPCSSTTNPADGIRHPGRGFFAAAHTPHLVTTGPTTCLRYSCDELITTTIVTIHSTAPYNHSRCSPLRRPLLDLRSDLHVNSPTRSTSTSIPLA